MITFSNEPTMSTSTHIDAGTSLSLSHATTITTRHEPEDMRVQQTRSQAIKLALGGYKTLKDSRTGVIFLKGGLAISQITCLLVLFALAHHQASPISPEHKQTSLPETLCSKPLDKWIIASIIRLGVCWNVSLWMVFRRKAIAEGDEEQDENGQTVRPNEALASRPSSSSATMPTLYKDARGPMVRNLSDGKEIPRGDKKDTYEEQGGQVIDDRQPRASMLTKMATIMDWAAPKLSMLLGLASLGLFIYGNIILFSSLQTCRLSTPLLWWAVMTVTGVGWFLLLEVVFVILVVGVVGPGILVLLRRIGVVAPLPAPALPFPLPPKPVDASDLSALHKVVYLPLLSSSEEDSLEQDGQVTDEKATKSSNLLAGVMGRKIVRQANIIAQASTQSVGQVQVVREVGYRYPVVRLAKEKAGCTICLVDFVEAVPSVGEQPSTTDAESTEEENVLRLLDCGHIFHADCIDHWLTSASGRCPVCNQAVVKAAGTDESARMLATTL